MEWFNRRTATLSHSLWLLVDCSLESADSAIDHNTFHHVKNLDILDCVGRYENLVAVCGVLVCYVSPQGSLTRVWNWIKWIFFPPDLDYWFTVRRGTVKHPTSLQLCCIRWNTWLHICWIFLRSTPTPQDHPKKRSHRFGKLRNMLKVHFHTYTLSL